jgi:TatD DNase family protein
MLDTHVHLNGDSLFPDWRATCDRAVTAGVSTCIVIGYDLTSSACAVEIADADTRCFAAVGIHPHDATTWNEETRKRLRQWTENRRVVAIGEIGLDFYTGQNNERHLAPRSVQEKAFRDQLQLAKEVGLPVVIHCREAYDETLELLEKDAADTPIILHCFAGTREHAERAFARNWYLGVGGTVTYKKNQELRDIVRAAPQTALLLETDAPYLSPEPLRGKFPNLPERIPLIAACIAQIREETVESVSAYTDANAHRVFRRLM